MKSPLTSFLVTVLVLWLLIGIAGIAFAQHQNIPGWIAAAVLPAIALELTFYAATGFAAVRDRLATIPPKYLAAILVKTSLAPWFLYAAATGHFDLRSFAVLLTLTAAVAYWYIVLPRTFVTDISLLILIAGVTLSKVFKETYPTPYPKVALDFLGKLMLIRLTVFVFLLLRKAEHVNYGFLPTKQDWIVGLRYYLKFMPFGIALGYAMGYIRIVMPPQPAWQVPLLAIGIFTGILWVVALSEEFFFRGLLLPWLDELLDSPLSALTISSICFGLVHLPFRGPWNWKHAAITAVLAWFCGQAYQETKGIRAPMVTHALVVTTWFVAFGKG